MLIFLFDLQSKQISHTTIPRRQVKYKSKKNYWRTIPTSAIHATHLCEQTNSNASRNNARAKFSWWKRRTNTKATKEKKMYNKRAPTKKHTANKKKIYNTCRVCWERKKNIGETFRIGIVSVACVFQTLLRIYSLSLLFQIVSPTQCCIMLWVHTHDCTHHTQPLYRWRRQRAARSLWLSWHTQL